MDGEFGTGRMYVTHPNKACPARILLLKINVMNVNDECRLRGQRLQLSHLKRLCGSQHATTYIFSSFKITFVCERRITCRKTKGRLQRTSESVPQINPSLWSTRIGFANDLIGLVKQLVSSLHRKTSLRNLSVMVKTASNIEQRPMALPAPPFVHGLGRIILPPPPNRQRFPRIPIRPLIFLHPPVHVQNRILQHTRPRKRRAPYRVICITRRARQQIRREVLRGPARQQNSHGPRSGIERLNLVYTQSRNVTV